MSENKPLWEIWDKYIQSAYPSGKRWVLGEMEAEMASKFPDMYKKLFPGDKSAETWRRLEALALRMKKNERATEMSKFLSFKTRLIELGYQPTDFALKQMVRPSFCMNENCTDNELITTHNFIDPLKSPYTKLKKPIIFHMKEGCLASAKENMIK